MLLAENLRKKAHSIWEANFNHPFVQELGKGILAEDKFIFFLEQDYVYLIEFCKFLGMAVAKAHSLLDMQRFSKVLDALLNFEMDLHRRVCADFGISAQKLEEVKPAPYNLAYTSYLLKTAYEGDFGDILAALLPCMWGYSEIGLRLKKQGIPPHKHYADWVNTYASDEFASLANWGKELLNNWALDQKPEKLKKLEEHFIASSRWEYYFWEMAYKKIDWMV